MKNQIPKTLIFSANDSNRRKKGLILVCVLAFFQLCLIWPVYPLFASATPLILGFPMSLVWVVLILVLSFSSLLIFYKTETDSEG